MITATFLSFCSCSTFRAVGEVSVVSRVLVELCLVVILVLAFTIGVPCLSTLEAHLESTLTYAWLVSTLALLNIVKAAWLGAPSEFRVQINNDVLMKAQVLRVNILRSELSNILTFVYHWTPSLHTLNLQHLSFQHVYSQVIRNALFALSMATLQPEHVLFVII